MRSVAAPRRFPAALVPIGLFLFALPVMLTGGIILWTLAAGGEGTLTEPADTLRRAQYPVALTLHVIGGMAMFLLAIIQVTPALRRRFPRWHRWAGRGLVLCGIGFAMTGIAMNLSPAAIPDTPAYDAAQNLAAIALIACLASGVWTIRQGHMQKHRAWMIRAYAISLAAATQTMTLLPVYLLIGPPTGLISNIVLIGAWPLNLIVAEWIIRRPQSAAPIIRIAARS